MCGSGWGARVVCRPWMWPTDDSGRAAQKVLQQQDLTCRVSTALATVGLATAGLW